MNTNSTSTVGTTSEWASSTMAGVAYKVCSVFFFVLMAAIIKSLTDRFPIGQLAFFRSFFAILPILLILYVQEKSFTPLKTNRLGSHMWRAVWGMAGMFLGFLGLARLPLADHSAIIYVSPMITVVLGYFLLGERVRIYRWSAVAIGFAGVGFILAPNVGGEVSDVRIAGVIYSGLAALVIGYMMIVIRKMTETERAITIVFYFSLFGALLTLLTLPFGWNFPTWPELGLLVLAGVLGGIAQMLLTQSYRVAETSLIAPFEYTSVIWTVLIGYLWFGDSPTWHLYVGASIVILAGIFVLWRESRLGLLSSKAQRARSSH